MKNTILNNVEAEGLAIEVLVFLSGDEKRFHAYLNVTGLDPQTIREAAGDSNFLTSVLDYLMQDESLLLQFCELQAISPTAIPSAHSQLDGSRHGSDG